MFTQHRAANYYPDQLYHARSLSSEMGVSASGHYHDLPYQAYDARKHDANYRLAFVGDLIGQIVEADAKDHGLVHRAEALHVVSVPLLNEVAPRDLVELLAPALDKFVEHRNDYPELHRYSGLLLRTVSLAASKLDSYTHAFAVMNHAHWQLNTDRKLRRRTAIHVAEARQQIYLQECGQLSRNVEAALLEQDRALITLNLDGRLPNRNLDHRDELRAMRIVARAAAEAGRRAAYWINFVKEREGLPASVDPENRRLAVSSWYLTCAIMYMRALLLAGLIELCANNDPSPYLLRVPDLWASVIEKHPAWSGHAEPKVEKNHRMDLTRNALLWAFLHNVDHPYRPRPYAQIREGVPDYLCTPVSSKLDTKRCADEIAKETHNAGILDNLAHVDTYRLLVERGGSSGLGYDSWLSHRHNRLKTVVDAEDPNPAEIRTFDGPTKQHLKDAAGMVLRSRRYDMAVHGV